MPVEGQAQRLTTSLRPLDKYFFVAVALVAVLGIGVGAYVYATRPPAPSNAGCVVVTVPSSLGGTTLRNCGAAAKRFCLAQVNPSSGIVAECRRHGFAVATAR